MGWLAPCRLQGGDSPTLCMGGENSTPFVAGARSCSHTHTRTRSHPPRGHTIGRPPVPFPLWYFPYFPTFHKLNTPPKSFVFACGIHPRRHPEQEPKQDRGAQSGAGQGCRDSAVSDGLRFPWLRPTGSLFLSVTFFLAKKRKQPALVTSAPVETGSVTSEDTTSVSVGKPNFVLVHLSVVTAAPPTEGSDSTAVSLCDPQTRGLNPAPAPPTCLPAPAAASSSSASGLWAPCERPRRVLVLHRDSPSSSPRRGNKMHRNVPHRWL